MFQQIFREFIFTYGETLTISSRGVFPFAIFALPMSNLFMLGKEELFMKSPKLKNHVYNNQLKSKNF